MTNFFELLQWALIFYCIFRTRTAAFPQTEPVSEHVTRTSAKCEQVDALPVGYTEDGFTEVSVEKRRAYLGKIKAEQKNRVFKDKTLVDFEYESKM